MPSVNFARLLNGGYRRSRQISEQVQSLLPTRSDEHVRSVIPPKEVTAVALRLKYLVESVITCELDEKKVTRAHSHIITPEVIECAKSAGGESYKACVVFCFLVAKGWFQTQANRELWDAGMYNLRATACEVIASNIIDGEEDQKYLLEEVLLQRYSMVMQDKTTVALNAVEKASDLHALRVIGSSGYQKCVLHVWKGWLVEDEEDASRFIEDVERTNTYYWSHFRPGRMRVPQYQNALEIAFSVLYLALYSAALSTMNRTADLDIIEALLYVFTAGFVLDEITKIIQVGVHYLAFWNIFNSVLYALLTISFITRLVALGHPLDSHERTYFNELSYNFLAFSAPMFWARLLLYLDTFQFFGVMLIVLQVMMRESIIFFALLFVVLVGFLQAFIGLDEVGNFEGKTVGFVVTSMLNAIMTSPEFSGFESFSPPFGLILYYIYTFIVMVVLLNILIALYNSAYQEIVDNATDEYMALFTLRTIQFVRPPYESGFIAPLNLFGLFFLALPFQWWMDKSHFARLKTLVLTATYAPFLLITSAVETKRAQQIIENIRIGEDEDDDTDDEWEMAEEECSDYNTGSWKKRVAASKPNVEDDPVQDSKALRKEVDELKNMIGKLLQDRGIEDKSNDAETGDSSSARYPTPDAG